MDTEYYTGRLNIVTEELEVFCRDVYSQCKIEQARIIGGSDWGRNKVPECWRDGAFQYDYQFKKRMNEKAKEMGLLPEKFGKENPNHLGSYARLGSIWKLQKSQAAGFRDWNTKLSLSDNPLIACVEIVVVRHGSDALSLRKQWRKAMCDLVGRSTAMITPEGRMLARRYDPIWAYVSRFGVPWKPFDFADEVLLRNIRWKKAEELGFDDQEEIKTQDSEYSFDWSYEGFMRFYLDELLVSS